jgi:hypothetical protein
MRPTEFAIVHHTASDMSFEDVIAFHTRSTKASNPGRGYKDIAYHFFIEENGILHLGRALDVEGAHDLGQNVGSIGICLQGDWRTVPWTGKNELVRPNGGGSARLLQWQSLLRLLNELLRQDLIFYVEGHLENEPSGTPTECPGFDPERIRHALGWGWKGGGEVGRRDIIENLQAVIKMNTGKVKK